MLEVYAAFLLVGMVALLLGMSMAVILASVE